MTSSVVLERLVQLLARLPGMGARSGRRMALHLIKNRDSLLHPLIHALTAVEADMRSCGCCGNLDSRDPCWICQNAERDESLLCVVEQVADLWAMERARLFQGRYHVLGGVLSAIHGMGPLELGIHKLIQRVQTDRVEEVILALNATLEGQTTVHYVHDRLREAFAQRTVVGTQYAPARITQLAQGLPVGGELDYLDEGTLAAAFASRRSLS